MCWVNPPGYLVLLRNWGTQRNLDMTGFLPLFFLSFHPIPTLAPSLLSFFKPLLFLPPYTSDASSSFLCVLLGFPVFRPPWLLCGGCRSQGAQSLPSIIWPVHRCQTYSASCVHLVVVVCSVVLDQTQDLRHAGQVLPLTHFLCHLFC